MVSAYEQKPEAVKAWLDEEYPKIAARAKLENAEIHWGDETALVNTDVRGRGYQPKGQTPIAFAVGGSRQLVLDNPTKRQARRSDIMSASRMR